MSVNLTIYMVIGLIIGVILHEYMHGRVADILGDKTARNAGRLTLNPIPHIDIFGSILIPLVLIVLRSPILFGYAKPVPINPFFLRKPRRDMLLVALAGPTTNFTIALVFALIGLVMRLAGVDTVSASSVGFQISEPFAFLYMAALINVWLGLFNLIPIPPLDGSHILEFFLSPSARETYEKIAPFGFIIILALLFVISRVLAGPLNAILGVIQSIMGLPAAPVRFG